MPIKGIRHDESKSRKAVELSEQTGMSLYKAAQILDANYGSAWKARNRKIAFAKARREA
jgi:hypothetical protein